VALGAAIQRGLISGEPLGHILLDVTAHSLGIRTIDEIDPETGEADYFSVIIRRNIRIPARQAEVYFTLRESQPAVSIEVYQGEEVSCLENVPVGHFDFPLKPAPARSPILIEFAYDKEGLVQAQSAQWQEAWRNLCRWALRLPGHLEEFWQHLGELKHIPDFPDFVLIRQLKDYLEAEEVRPAIAALTGLSPAAQLFREKLLSWSGKAAQDKKIARLLKTLVVQPEKVTGQTFAELGTLLAPNPLSETIRSLSIAINQVRRFNSKIAKGRRNWVGLEDSDLKILDNQLNRLAGSLDPVLREVLLYPFKRLLPLLLN
jgi:molecular chaperone DnaK (HSP70)